ncbi:MAG: hypothetical protein ACNA8H_06120 [Anaerolineales bacterium]
MPKLIQPTEDLSVRIDEYFEEEFSYGRSIHADYIDRLIHAKTSLLKLLNLPRIDSGWLFENGSTPPAHEIYMVFYQTINSILHYEDDRECIVGVKREVNHEYTTMLRYSEDKTNKEFFIDWPSMTYKHEGRQHNILRKLRKAPEFIQRGFAWTFLYKSGVSLPRGVESVSDTCEHLLHYLNADGAVNFDKLWPRVGEFVKVKPRRFLLTCDPVMLLGQSVGSFSSCHAPDGCHKFGPMAYAADRVTVGLFEIRDGREDPDEIFTPQRSNSGRCLFYVPDPEHPFYIQSRRYGSLQDFEIKFARDFIGKSLRETNGLLPATWKTESSLYVRAPECLYLDYPSYGQAYTLDGFSGITTRIDDALCPCCLSRFEEKEGCCISSYENHCESCSDGLHQDDIYWVDETPYCQECFDNIFYRCDECGEPIHRDYAIHTEDGYVMCQYCADNRTHQCEHCGELWWSRDPREPVTVNSCGDQEDWCHSCLDDAVVCADCGERFEAGLLNEDGYCDSCEQEREAERERIAEEEAETEV